MLPTLYRNDALRGDIVTRAGGQHTLLYNSENHYPYRSDLIIYNFQKNTRVCLLDSQAARVLFRMEFQLSTD